MSPIFQHYESCSSYINNRTQLSDAFYVIPPISSSAKTSKIEKLVRNSPIPTAKSLFSPGILSPVWSHEYLLFHGQFMHQKINSHDFKSIMVQVELFASPKQSLKWQNLHSRWNLFLDQIDPLRRLRDHGDDWIVLAKILSNVVEHNSLPNSAFQFLLFSQNRHFYPKASLD